jgi:hypothetical protein
MIEDVVMSKLGADTVAECERIGGFGGVKFEHTLNKTIQNNLLHLIPIECLIPLRLIHKLFGDFNQHPSQIVGDHLLRLATYDLGQEHFVVNHGSV